MCVCNAHMMIMVAFITFNRSLVPLIEGLCSSSPWEFEFSGFRRNRTDDLGINSSSLWAGTRHLEGPKNRDGINFGICVFVFVSR